MGGPGSTRWRGYDKRRLVEDCLVFDLSQLNRQGLFEHNDRLYRVDWVEPLNHVVIATAVVGVVLSDDRVGALALVYVLKGDPSETVAEEITLEGQRICSGGTRWYLRCPKCQRRGYKLYLPAGETRYRCRDCYDLTHLSVQGHDCRVDAFKRDPQAFVDAVKTHGGPPKSFHTLALAMKALPRRLQVWPTRPWPGPSDAELRLSRVDAEEFGLASAG